MKIIKDGDLSRLRKTIRFKCHKCGCIFEADMGEYVVRMDQRNGEYYSCGCPTCGSVVTFG